MEVKCLSVKSPLSYLICAGIKDVENRTWTTEYRGRLYIHSSGEPVNFYDECDFPKNIEKFPEYNEKINGLCADLLRQYEEAGIDIDKKIKKEDYYLKSHAIIGYVDLVDIVKDSKSPFAMVGCYHWIVENPVWIKPITNVKGRLSLWRYEI